MDIDWPALEPQAQTPAAAGSTLKSGSTEDSGYHTAFTPGSSELSGALDASFGVRARYSRLLDSASLPRRKFVRTRIQTPVGEVRETDVSPAPSCSSVAALREQYELCRSPPRRRPPKRSLEDVDERTWCLEVASTPTTLIAGDLQKLAVTDDNTPTPVPPFEERSRRDFATSDYYSLSSIAEISRPLSYPTTPVKSSRCKVPKLSPRGERRSSSKHYSPSKAIKENCCPRRSVKKLNFVPSTKEPVKSEPKSVRPLFAPDKKVDIITRLSECDYPVLSTILGFLEGEDVYNFSRVSLSWESICASNTKAYRKKEEYAEFIKVTKENHRNREIRRRTERSCADGDKLPSVSLRDIHNVINGRQNHSTPIRSPPRTPRSTKFRNFTKSASLDTRLQLSCVRCGLPAKVTEESGGEQWAQCCSATCAFCFCRYCKCSRHPGRLCFQYSLDVASPSKRCKRSNSVTGTTKSKKILRRLLV